VNNKIMVKKFGGTSMGSTERIQNVAARLKRDLETKQEFPIVVASAMSGETNRLIALADQIDPRHRGSAYDMLVASGEQVSIALLSIALTKLGLQAQPLLAYQLGIQTDRVYSKARIQKIDVNRLQQLCEQGIIPVVAGFQGVDQDDNITTLGRGGSDTTAVALAAALNSSDCEIYTDVPAVFTADPRIVPKAREIARISFEEMMEMASLGSKVLHIRSVEIAAKFGVRIHVRSTFEDRPGTWIIPEGEIMENPVVSSVTHDSNTVIFQLHPIPRETEFLANLFERLSQAGVVVDIITQGEQDGAQRLAFSVTNEDVPLTQTAVEKFLGVGTNVHLRQMPQKAKISVVGVGMRNHPGVAATFFRVLAREGVDIHLVTTSEIKISAVIDQSHVQRAAQALHQEFGLS